MVKEGLAALVPGLILGLVGLPDEIGILGMVLTKFAETPLIAKEGIYTISQTKLAIGILGAGITFLAILYIIFGIMKGE